nr:hypothetical protein GCM10020092_070200 [Actinoplanes digitatis]
MTSSTCRRAGRVAALRGEQEAAGVPVEGRGDRGQARADAGPALLEGRALGTAGGYRGLDGLADELERAGGRRVQFAQVLTGLVQGDPGTQPFGQVCAQRAGRRGVNQDLELAQGADGEIGAGLMALRAVVGQAVDILLAGLDDRRAGVEADHLTKKPVREVVDHG